MSPVILDLSFMKTISIKSYNDFKKLTRKEFTHERKKTIQNVF